MKKIALACDHAGFEYKEKIKAILSEQGHSLSDFGCFSEESVDYPDFAHDLANAVSNGDCEVGIQFCGSGNGINMSANKHQAIRSALCWQAEIAELARLHNDANVCTMPARYISFEEVKTIVDTFLKTDFEGGRHERRVNKIACC
jgi:ribose 5-phosphate isomerase B